MKNSTMNNIGDEFKVPATKMTLYPTIRPYNTIYQRNQTEDDGSAINGSS
jgi:hypothetical protein